MICEPAAVQLDIRRLYLAGTKGLILDGVRVPITTTRCNFGGERRWFLCPYCSRRCAVLYRPDCRCRLCARGHYQTEHLSPLDRKIVKSRNLRRKLGQYQPNMSMPVPEKPHRMRWHTFLRIRAEIMRLELEIVTQLNR